MKSIGYVQFFTIFSEQVVRHTLDNLEEHGCDEVIVNAPSSKTKVFQLIIEEMSILDVIPFNNGKLQQLPTMLQDIELVVPSLQTLTKSKTEFHLLCDALAKKNSYITVLDINTSTDNVQGIAIIDAIYNSFEYNNQATKKELLYNFYTLMTDKGFNDEEIEKELILSDSVLKTMKSRYRSEIHKHNKTKVAKSAPKKRNTSKKEKAQILKLLKSGMKAKEIAKQVGVKHGVVYNTAYKHDININNNRITKETERFVIGLLRIGTTHESVQKICNVGKNTVTRIKKEMGA